MATAAITAVESLATKAAPGGVVGGLLSGVSSIIGRFKETPDLKAEDAFQLQLAQLQINEAMAQMQSTTNTAEAANSNLFVSGWRPFVGWACGSGLAYAIIVQPFLTFVLVALKVHFDATLLPKLDTGTIIDMLVPMLGLGAMRTYEKVNGVGTQNH